eukprot:7480019-Pyramimonas_sp.AAC.1
MPTHHRSLKQLIQGVPKPPNTAPLDRKESTGSERHPQELTAPAGPLKLVDDKAHAPQLLDNDVETTSHGPRVRPQGEGVAVSPGSLRTTPGLPPSTCSSPLKPPLSKAPSKTFWQRWRAHEKPIGSTRTHGSIVTPAPPGTP